MRRLSNRGRATFLKQPYRLMKLCLRSAGGPPSLSGKGGSESRDPAPICARFSGGRENLPHNQAPPILTGYALSLSTRFNGFSS